MHFARHTWKKLTHLNLRSRLTRIMKLWVRRAHLNYLCLTYFLQGENWVFCPWETGTLLLHFDEKSIRSCTASCTTVCSQKWSNGKCHPMSNQQLGQCTRRASSSLLVGSLNGNQFDNVVFLSSSPLNQIQQQITCR